MDIINKADKYLNGNYHLLNIIFSFLGQSPSAKVICELANDEELNALLNRSFCSYPEFYFDLRNCERFKNKTFNIQRFKVDTLKIDDGVNCERCDKLLTYKEREIYYGYCQNCDSKKYYTEEREPEDESSDSDEYDSDEYDSDEYNSDIV